MTKEMKATFDLNSFLPYTLNNIATQMSEQFSELYQSQFDLTVPQWRIIANLAQYGQLSAKSLCDLAHMDKSTVSRAVKRLLERDIISAQSDPLDKRATLLSLTRDGSDMVEKIRSVALDWQAEMLKDINEHEYENFISTLNKVYDSLNKNV
ncbi:MarR family winged helix-turn-helix transcriptional regulator [Pseudoalteromonas lipolytica]|nr:MarR family winged helix-turn-helix transcriptional regulator [Pseudoalteromonas donghaensis]